MSRGCWNEKNSVYLNLKAMEVKIAGGVEISVHYCVSMKAIKKLQSF